MPFPLSINGEVDLPIVPADDFRKRVIFACMDELEHERCVITQRTGDGIRFSAPTFRGRFDLRLWFTAPLDGGRIEVDATGDAPKLRYQLSTRRLTAWGSVLTFLFLLWAREKWWITLMASAWCVGLPYLIALIRAPRWMRKRITDAEESAMQTLAIATSALGAGSVPRRPLR